MFQVPDLVHHPKVVEEANPTVVKEANPAVAKQAGKIQNFKLEGNSSVYN